jgi:hypothetical protein
MAIPLNLFFRYLAPIQIRMKVECCFVKDALKGDEQSEIYLKLIELINDEAVPDYED